jgi:hypothetical protein
MQDDDIKNLQAQIVEMRLRIEHQGEAMAALTKHYVEHEIATVLKGRIPSKEVTDWATLEYEKAKERKKDFKDLLMHSLKLGSAATAAFIVVAMWEAFKAKVTGEK